MKNNLLRVTIEITLSVSEKEWEWSVRPLYQNEVIDSGWASTYEIASADAIECARKEMKEKQ
jgi:hypothetical protein